MPPTVLVVEDYADLAELLCQLLQRAGIAATSAASGSTAIEVAKAHTPDAVLLDLMLPDMSGIDVCRQLKANRATADAPVIFVTCAEGENCSRDCFRFGAYDIIFKPYDPQSVVQTVFASLQWRHTQEIHPHDGEIHLDATEPKVSARGLEELFLKIRQSPQLTMRLRDTVSTALAPCFYPQDAAASGLPSPLTLQYKIIPDPKRDMPILDMHFHWPPSPQPQAKSWFGLRKREDAAPPWLGNIAMALHASILTMENGDAQLRCDGLSPPPSPQDGLPQAIVGDGHPSSHG